METLVERIVGPTMEMKNQEAEVYKAKYIIAKKACHIQSAQIEKKDQEIAELQETIKYMMREYEKCQNQSALKPNRDVY